MRLEEKKVTVKEALKKVDGLIDDQAKTFSKDDLRVLYALAFTLYEGGDVQEAKKVFERLISCDPFTQKYWMGLAACSQQEKNYEEALKGWGMASLLENSNPTPHFHAAECYMALENRDEGKKAIEACRKRLGNNVSLVAKLNHLADFCMRKEKEGA
ncbi:MAG: SycD/LcrH family type III secretion system chaperone [Chlamydiia bacterium]|nr:SycD/LcrH family type III secretion system chaperone [Chlamydiia bacterium]